VIQISGLTLITKGMLQDPSLIKVYRACSFETSVDSINKRLNIRVDEIKEYNILSMNTRDLNVTILNNNVNISPDSTNQINIQRS